MLSDYRSFLASELELLGNASHHAYSFGQANMAKRALERLDAELADRVPLLLDRADVRELLLALETLGEDAATLPPALATLRERLRDATPQA
ncbi:MAG: hypothetical protein NVS4B5_11810 [Vulcanimicrobiaceae bacterium]